MAKRKGRKRRASYSSFKARRRTTRGGSKRRRSFMGGGAVVGAVKYGAVGLGGYLGAEMIGDKVLEMVRKAAPSSSFASGPWGRAVAYGVSAFILGRVSRRAVDGSISNTLQGGGMIRAAQAAYTALRAGGGGGGGSPPAASGSFLQTVMRSLPKPAGVAGYDDGEMIGDGESGGGFGEEVFDETAS